MTKSTSSTIFPSSRIMPPSVESLIKMSWSSSSPEESPPSSWGESIQWTPSQPPWKNGTYKRYTSNMSGKEPMKSPKEETTLSSLSKITEVTTTTLRKRETWTPWTWMPSKLKNSPLKKDKDVLTTTFASNVANLDIDPPNAKTLSWENRNNRPPPLPRSKKSLMMKNQPPLEEFPQWIFKRKNLPDARDP